jgi:hypothetical protein
MERNETALQIRGTLAETGVRFDPPKDLEPGKSDECGITGMDTLRNRAISQESLKRNDRAAGRVARAVSAPDRS